MLPQGVKKSSGGLVDREKDNEHLATDF